MLELAFDQRAIKLLSKVTKKLAAISPIEAQQFELFNRMLQIAIKYKELGMAVCCCNGLVLTRDTNAA